MQKLTITQPDDWHVHVRDHAILRTVINDLTKRFARAIVMPNLNPPVVSVDMATAYRERILAVIPKNQQFEPLMTLYLTDAMTRQEIIKAANTPYIHAIKLYPKGATTYSEEGVTHTTQLYPIFETMEQYNLPLCIHGEVTDPDVDIFDREKFFIERELEPIMRKFPKLRIVLEHITTQDAVQFVQSAAHPIAATITVHHLLFNRNNMLSGGIHPHYYCLPVLKRERHRQALVQAATSGHPCFFLGTDSAPHSRVTKESACGCAGIYTSHAAIELYASVFEKENKLDRLEAFASFFGPDFYQLPRNQSKIHLVKETWTVENEINYDRDSIVPLYAGQSVMWKIVS